MPSSATTPEEYISELPDDRKHVMKELRNVIRKNLPDGFEEIVNYGMLSYVVPHSVYPAGYHADPKQPLPFLSIASQKNFVAVYHMAIYADQELLQWFREEYVKQSKTKLDMGKSCIRFKKIQDIPLALIGELATRVSPTKWIATYEKQIKR